MALGELGEDDEGGEDIDGLFGDVLAAVPVADFGTAAGDPSASESETDSDDAMDEDMRAAFENAVIV